MNTLRNAIKTARATNVGRRNLGLSSLLCSSLRPLSTEAEQPNQDASTDPFLQTPKGGLVYGRLTGTSKYTTRSDIINLLEGCSVSLDDIKVDYTRSFTATGMLIQFPSQHAYLAAVRAIARKGRLYKLDRADRSQWDLIAPYDGKAALLQGIPPNALVDDVERFLSGCIYDQSTVQIFYRLTPSFPDPVRMALVHFPSQAHAMHAFITKNMGFCLNSQIMVRVLQ